MEPLRESRFVLDPRRDWGSDRPVAAKANAFAEATVLRLPPIFMSFSNAALVVVRPPLPANFRMGPGFISSLRFFKASDILSVARTGRCLSAGSGDSDGDLDDDWFFTKSMAKLFISCM